VMPLKIAPQHGKVFKITDMSSIPVRSV
jgi:hypothetical protein